jgi:hypothetical protein
MFFSTSFGDNSLFQRTYATRIKPYPIIKAGSILQFPRQSAPIATDGFPLTLCICIFYPSGRFNIQAFPKQQAMQTENGDPKRIIILHDMWT